MPVFGSFLKKVKKVLRHMLFVDSEQYWILRYKLGGNSGAGSYSKLAEFKAEIVNGFVEKHNVSTIIDHGCGDGNQLRLFKFSNYIGFDVSPKAVSLCREIFSKDDNKTFKLVAEYNGETAQLAVSLDVIFHLVEDETFDSYMKNLFNSSEQFVIIYSSNTDENSPEQDPHVKNRKFTKWIEVNMPTWELYQYIPNRYSFKGDIREGSASDFYIYKKTGS
jgi:hypothetical protein